ncbi:MAG: glycosyltransferase [Candidatus Gorgyraea atricola]|nr:glycosyltransferase [Candidatus Gorgyraea atricola]
MISVIIPTYNRPTLLKKAIDSVSSQTYKDFELIVIEDTAQKGPAWARNRGIEKSTKPFIAFLDSDDWWDKDKLAIQIDAMQKSPQRLISHTQEIWYKNGKLLNQKKKHKKHSGYIFDKCLPLCVVSMSTVMVRRELFDRVGVFNENLPCCEDYDFWLRTSVNHEFLLIDKPLTLKDGGRPDQLSSIYATGIDKYRIQSIRKLLDSSALTPGQRNLVAAELQRKCQIYAKGCLKHGKKEEGEHYLGLVGQV